VRSSAHIYEQKLSFLELKIDTTKTERVGSSPSTDYDIPLANNGFYSCTVKDKDTGQILRTITDLSHTRISFAVGGIKTVEIRGIFKSIKTSDGGVDNPKLLEVKWGQFKAKSFNNLRDCPNLVSVSGVLNLSETTTFAFVFQDTPNLLDIQDLNEYDVSGITGATNQPFLNCGFNTPHPDWDTSQWLAKFRMYASTPNYNQDDCNHHDHSLTSNFNQYLFQALSFNQAVVMDIPSATTLSLFMRQCINQAQNIVLTSTDLVKNWSQAFQGLTKFFASGSTISIDSFKSADNLTNMFSGTQLQIDNWSNILIQLANTFRSTDNTVANATQVAGTTVDFNIVNHNLQVGHGFLTKGFQPLAYNGLLTVTSVIDADNVRCELLSDPLGDATTIGTYDLPLNGLNIHGGSSLYNAAGEIARNQLTDQQGWTITDGGSGVPTP
jgi:hypothetical protein